VKARKTWSATAVGWLARLGGAPMADYLRYNRRYLEWRLAHPFGSFSDYYVLAETTRLDSGYVHPTLGRRPDPDDGADVLQILISQGLAPRHRVVDYGCGSLRIGRHLIAYLEPDRYWGLDVTDRFFGEGLANVDPALLAARRPRLAVIGRASLREAAAARPDFVIVVAVLHHVPERQLGAVFRRIARLCGPSTSVVVRFLESPTPLQVGRFSFRHTLDRVQRAARSAGLDTQVLTRCEEVIESPEKRKYRTLLRLSRRD